MEKIKIIQIILWSIVVIVILTMAIYFPMNAKDEFIHVGKAYLQRVDEICYSAHNESRINDNYATSWGSAYRSCLLENTNLWDEAPKYTFDEIKAFKEEK